MLYSYIKKLYAYNDWANKELLKCLSSQNVQDEFCLKMFSHVINAQFIWHRRMSEENNDYKIWDVWSFEQMQTALADNLTRWQVYFDKLNDVELERVFSYKNSAGDSFQSRVLDCIMHCVNHATHHRAQVGKRLRELGLTPPPSMDYIVYCRQTDVF
jgi:uncharacterized damage-inducible protein DinB